MNGTAITNIDGKRFLSVKELVFYTGLSRTRATEWGKAIGAVRPMGSRIFFDRVVIDRFMDSMTPDGDGFDVLPGRAKAHE